MSDMFATQLEPHPYAEIFPLLGEAEVSALADDIARHGLLRPITLYEGKVLDGRNRMRACEIAGVEPDTEEFSGNDALSWVVSHNLHRRHLSESQRGMVAGRLANMGDGRPSNRPNLVSNEDAAKRLNVGKGTVISAKKVQREGVPELVDAVDAGEVSVSKAARLAAEDEETQREAVEDKTFEAKPHVSNNSGNNEWYTPAPYIDAARRAMGSIELDPASCEEANKTVQAETFYSEAENGLEQSWGGNVWMNPPYAQPAIAHFCDRLCFDFEEGRVAQACVLVNNATDTKWFQQLARQASAVCFTKGRVRFYGPDGSKGAPLQGQAVVYLGPDAEAFRREFSTFGFVLNAARKGQ